MLEDRPYMRRQSFGSRRSVTITLLVINVAVFVLQFLLPRITSLPIDYYCALSIDGLRHGYVWQLLTYQFMHAGFMHLLLNCWAIFVFGREVEEALGQKSFLALYLFSGF